MRSQAEIEARIADLKEYLTEVDHIYNNVSHYALTEETFNPEEYTTITAELRALLWVLDNQDSNLSTE